MLQGDVKVANETIVPAMSASEAARVDALADDYKRGLDKMVASGYEEFGIDVLRNHATVIKALRFYAKSSQVSPTDTWTITTRRKMTERIFWAWSLLFCWPTQR